MSRSDPQPDEARPADAPAIAVEGLGDEFLESLMDTELYSIGAFFCDEHPELVDEVIQRSQEIEADGLRSWASAAEVSVEEGFGTLLTGLAVRYYKAVAG